MVKLVRRDRTPSSRRLVSREFRIEQVFNSDSGCGYKAVRVHLWLFRWVRNVQKPMIFHPPFIGLSFASRSNRSPARQERMVPSSTVVKGLRTVARHLTL